MADEDVLFEDELDLREEDQEVEVTRVDPPEVVDPELGAPVPRGVGGSFVIRNRCFIPQADRKTGGQEFTFGTTVDVSMEESGKHFGLGVYQVMMLVAPYLATDEQALLMSLANQYLEE